VRAEAPRLRARAGRRTAFREIFRGAFRTLFEPFRLLRFTVADRRFAPPARGLPGRPSPTSRARRRTIASSMLILRARHACLNFR